jgi:hypothetical protein
MEISQVPDGVTRVCLSSPPSRLKQLVCTSHSLTWVIATRTLLTGHVLFLTLATSHVSARCVVGDDFGKHLNRGITVRKGLRLIFENFKDRWGSLPQVSTATKHELRSED